VSIVVLVLEKIRGGLVFLSALERDKVPVARVLEANTAEKIGHDALVCDRMELVPWRIVVGNLHKVLWVDKGKEASLGKVAWFLWQGQSDPYF
jgi:hypothetical protein